MGRELIRLALTTQNPKPLKPQQIVEALEEAVQQLGVEVRHERGNFRGGLCTIDGARVVVLNKRRPVEAHLAVLAEALRALPVDKVYLRPAVRDAVEEAWAARSEEAWEVGEWESG